MYRALRTGRLNTLSGLPLAGHIRSYAGSSGRSSAACMAHTHDSLIAAIQTIVPPLNTESHKGQHGKVGIVGGCREYTGAPFFAAISAVRVGADLSHVICTSSAGAVIKGYSPELIVLPYLPDLEAHPTWDAMDENSQADITAHAMPQISPWLAKLGCLIVGPGLGDDPAVVATTRAIIKAARQLELPLIVDGSAINVVAPEPDLVRGYSQCVLTPNLPEFGRLAAGVGVQLEGSIGPQWQRQTAELAAAFHGPVVLSKGPLDVISDGSTSIICNQPSSLRRAGGQGDVLTGCTAAFLCWSRLHARKHPEQQQEQLSPLMLSAYGGSVVMRAASQLAFQEKGRSMLAGDIIPHLHQGFSTYFS